MSKDKRTAKRCEWASQEEIFLDYHDNEWGRQELDNQKLFEMLTLESMQAGLSWRLILEKRAAFDECFDHFDPKKIARYTEKKFQRLLKEPRIIRNQLKIRAVINNAKVYNDLIKQGTSLSEVVWGLVDHKPIVNKWKQQDQVPASTELSDRMTKVLKSLGFKFIGTTICYSFMQAVGMVNDHLIGCDWR